MVGERTGVLICVVGGKHNTKIVVVGEVMILGDVSVDGGTPADAAMAPFSQVVSL